MIFKQEKKSMAYPDRSIHTQGHLSLRDYYINYGNLSYEIDQEHTDRALTRSEMELMCNHLSGVKTSVHLCCGAGRHVEAFGNLGILSIGIDLSPYLIFTGSRKLKQDSLSENALLAVGAATLAPIRSQRIDCVTLLGNSFSLFDEEEGGHLFVEIKRVLRSSGLVILDIPCAKHVTSYLSDGLVKTSKRIETRTLGDVDIVWIRQLDKERHKVVSLETYTFLDENACIQVKRINFSFYLYEPEEICAIATATGFRLLSIMEHNDTSGRYLGMLRRRIFLIMQADA